MPEADPRALVAQARAELAKLPGLLESLLAGLDDEAARRRPAPGEWAPVEIVCHLRDEEREDFGARIRVVLAGGTEFERIDPEAWAVARAYREARLGDALAAFRAGRAESLELLAGVDPAALRATVSHPRAGRLSGLDLLAAWVAHDGLHLGQLAATLTRLWAGRWPGLAVGYAGDLPYPPPA